MYISKHKKLPCHSIWYVKIFLEIWWILNKNWVSSILLQMPFLNLTKMVAHKWPRSVFVNFTKIVEILLGHFCVYIHRCMLFRRLMESNNYSIFNIQLVFDQMCTAHWCTSDPSNFFLQNSFISLHEINTLFL